MNKKIKMIELYKNNKYGVAKHYYDVDVHLFGDGINTGCYVLELPSHAYKKEYQMTPSEVETLESLACKLIRDKKHDTYTLDLVKGTMTMSNEDEYQLQE